MPLRFRATGDGARIARRMPQETLVFQVPPAQQGKLERELASGDFERRTVEHARFSVKGQGVVATLYRSGKLVVQGSDARLFAERYLKDAEIAPGVVKAVEGPIEVGARALIGSDEAGKGDYFGPLVVAAVRADQVERAELVKAGVADSKTLSDERVRILAPALEQRYRVASEVLAPAQYNDEHDRIGNLNPLLAELHARCIRRLAEPGFLVLVDKFGDERLIAERVADLKLDLHQVPRAEADPVVAAASIIARNLFLEGLKELSEECAVDLHKGAGEPTDRAAGEFVRLHGREALRRVAKVHFKNTKRIRG